MQSYNYDSGRITLVKKELFDKLMNEWMQACVSMNCARVYDILLSTLIVEHFCVAKE